MADPFARAAARIMARVGGDTGACVFTRFATSERIRTVAVLDRDVEVIDELGNIVSRDDVISLNRADVGVPKSKDTVEFTESGETYTLGRTVRDDGYVAKMMAHRG